MVSGSETTSVFFKSLCAILKAIDSDHVVFKAEGNFQNPIITINGDGTAKVNATSLSGKPFKMGYGGSSIFYLPVAPGYTTIGKGGNMTDPHNGSVEAGKLYSVN